MPLGRQRFSKHETGARASHLPHFRPVPTLPCLRLAACHMNYNQWIKISVDFFIRCNRKKTAELSSLKNLFRSLTATETKSSTGNLCRCCLLIVTVHSVLNEILRVNCYLSMHWRFVDKVESLLSQDRRICIESVDRWILAADRYRTNTKISSIVEGGVSIVWDERWRWYAPRRFFSHNRLVSHINFCCWLLVSC